MGEKPYERDKNSSAEENAGDSADERCLSEPAPLLDGRSSLASLIVLDDYRERVSDKSAHPSNGIYAVLAEASKAGAGAATAGELLRNGRTVNLLSVPYGLRRRRR